MKLKDHDLKQIDRDYLKGLPPEKLLEVSENLLEDLKEARDQLNQTPENSSRPSSSFAPWEGSIVTDGSPVEEEADKDEEGARKSRRRKKQSRKMKKRRRPGNKKEQKDRVEK